MTFFDLGDLGYGYPDRHCPGCGTGLMAAERCSVPGCPQARRARGGNLTGRAAETLLGELFADPVEARALARLRTTARLRALRSRCLDGAEALDALDRQAAGLAVEIRHHWGEG